MYYFAYGSNMKTDRLEGRIGIGEVKVLGKAILRNYGLRFDKLGNDGNGKANVQPENDSTVEGVLFDLTEEQLNLLDKKEGVPTHYMRQTMDIIKSDNDTAKAEIYVANPKKVGINLKPSCEYRQYLIDGANEHNLSEQYKEFLESFECV